MCYNSTRINTMGQVIKNGWFYEPAENGRDVVNDAPYLHQLILLNQQKHNSFDINIWDGKNLVEAQGIEPWSRDCKSPVIPLYHAPNSAFTSAVDATRV